MNITRILFVTLALASSDALFGIEPAYLQDDNPTPNAAIINAYLEACANGTMEKGVVKSQQLLQKYSHLSYATDRNGMLGIHFALANRHLETVRAIIGFHGSSELTQKVPYKDTNEAYDAATWAVWDAGSSHCLDLVKTRLKELGN